MTPIQMIAPFIGALLMEVLHWYQLRNRLSSRRVTKAARNPAYWVVTIAMIVLGSVGTLIVFGESLQSAGQLLIAGAAFPTIFKKLVSAFADKQELMLGANQPETGAPSVLDYFRV
jgi:hypothetical protein